MSVRRFLCSASALSAVLAAQPAWADEKAQCASAYEQAQELRGQAKLREARNNLLVCAQAACPAFIKKDCSKWLSEVEAALPTVVFSAKSKGSDLTEVTVKMDGEDVTEVLDGRAVPVDPGPHTFVFESEQHGTKEVRYVVKEGQKSQSLEVDFGGDQAAAGDDPTADSSATLTTDDAAKSPVLAYALLGVGVVGLGGFAYFGLSANSDKDALDCADSKTCTDDDLDPIRQKYLFADISLGVGLVSLGVGTYLLLTANDKPKPAANADSANVRFDVVPSRAGGFASVSGSF